MLAVNEYMDWGVKEVADFLSQNDVDSEVIEAFKGTYTAGHHRSRPPRIPAARN